MTDRNVFYRHNKAPICVNLKDWPVVAEASAAQVLYDGSYFGAATIIRRHKDGRVLSEFAVAGGLLDGQETSILTETCNVVSIADEAKKVHDLIRYMGAGFVAGLAFDNLIKSLPCEYIE